MSRVIIGVATAVLLAAVPAVAKEKAAKATGGDRVWNENKELLEQEGQNREPGPDGTFQGKPVVAGPADWHSKMGGDASAGASSGEAGSAKAKARDQSE
jgi:hypothetical protein